MASISCPSKNPISLTGLTSTNEPGKNAFTTPISTVKPPFTLPVTIALIGVFSCIANSSSCHILAVLAFSLDKRV